MNWVLMPFSSCWHSNSEVWMEFFATISHSTDLVNRESVINKLRLIFFEDSLAILVDTKTEISLDVRWELKPVDGLVFKEIGLLLEQTQNHSLDVRVSVDSAIWCQVICYLHLGIAFRDLLVREALQQVWLDGESLLRWFPWVKLSTVKTHISLFFYLILYLLIIIYNLLNN